MPVNKLITASLCLAIVVGVTAVACDSNRPVPTELRARDRVLVVAADGFEWGLALELLREGRLPTLAGLMQTGVYGELKSMRPTKSPVIWTSVATGVPPAQHGIKDFLKPRRGRPGALQVYSNLDRRTKAFWNILSDAGRRVSIVGWWTTYPAEAVNGVMVSQVNTTQPSDKLSNNAILKGALVAGLADQVYPPERQDELVSVLSDVEADLPALERSIYGDFQYPISALARDLLAQSRWAVRADEVYRRISLRLMKESSWDLFAVYFGGADVMGHRFWRYLYPHEYKHRPSKQEVSDYGQIAPRYYEHLDGVIGDLIEASGEGINVIVVGDHGMNVMNRNLPFKPPMRRGHMLSGGHPRAPAAVFIASGPNLETLDASVDVSRLERSDVQVLGSVLDVTPTLLALLGEPTDRSMKGRVLERTIAASFLAQHPIKTVASYTDHGWASRRFAEVPGDLNVDERLLQLRALGYVE